MIEEYIAKAMQARASMWSAIGNVLGFIISASSIVSALSKPVWWILLPILFASFGGIMAILRCFQLSHRRHIEIAADLIKQDQRSDEEKLAEAKREIEHHDPLDQSEFVARFLLWISAILFLLQAVKSFC